jgi:hypothetical protein
MKDRCNCSYAQNVWLVEEGSFNVVWGHWSATWESWTLTVVTILKPFTVIYFISTSTKIWHLAAAGKTTVNRFFQLPRRRPPPSPNYIPRGKNRSYGLHIKVLSKGLDWFLSLKDQTCRYRTPLLPGLRHSTHRRRCFQQLAVAKGVMMASKLR